MTVAFSKEGGAANFQDPCTALNTLKPKIRKPNTKIRRRSKRETSLRRSGRETTTPDRAEQLQADYCSLRTKKVSQDEKK